MKKKSLINMPEYAVYFGKITAMPTEEQFEIRSFHNYNYAEAFFTGLKAEENVHFASLINISKQYHYDHFDKSIKG